MGCTKVYTLKLSMGLLKPSGSLEDKLLGTTTQGTLAPRAKPGNPAFRL